MASFDEELSPEQRLKFRQKAYDKFINIAQPGLEAKQGIESTDTTKRGLRDIYKGIQLGGYTGRQQASEAMDKTQLEIAKLKGQQAAEKDQLAVQGAGMKEDIIGSRQKEYLSQFNRKTQEMEDAMDKALAERTFELGMTAKELLFHANAKVADLGLEQLKDEYDAGNVSKLELQTIAANLQRAATAAKHEADVMLAKLKAEGQQAVTLQSRKRSLELAKQMLEKQKAAAKAAVKASNISAIISGLATAGGAGIGAYLGGPGGAVAGGTLGAKLGQTAAGVGTAAYNIYG